MQSVAEAMTTPVPTIGPDASMQAASIAMLDAGTHAVVVVRDERLAGLLTADDIATAMSRGYDVTSTRAAEFAHGDPMVAEPDEPLAMVHDRMRAARRPIAAVVDGHGHPVGLLVDPDAA